MIPLPETPSKRVRVLMIIHGPAKFTELAKRLGCAPVTLRGVVYGTSWSPGVARKLELYYGIPIFPELHAKKDKNEN